MNLLIQPNQICLIVKLYNNRPELLPDSNEIITLSQFYLANIVKFIYSAKRPKSGLTTGI